MAAAKTLPDELRNRDRARLANYKKAIDWYSGRQWPAARTATQRRARRLTLNYARTFTAKSAATVLKGRTNVVKPTSDTDPTTDELALADAVEVALGQVHEQNRLDALDYDTELDAAVLGDGCYKVFWDGERVRVTAPDPSGIFAWHTPDDINQIWRVANRYAVEQSGIETLGLKPDDNNELVEVWTLDLYELWHNNALVDARPNPYGFIPFVIFPNMRDPKQFWGTSDLAPLYDPLEELNREVTQLSAIMELSGNPIAALSNVDESDDIAVYPGAVWQLPKDARADLLDLLRDGGVRLHIDYLNAIYRVMHDLGETPRAAFGDTGGRDLSGVALELELDPLVKKTERKRLTRKHAYRDRNEMILALLDQFTGTAFSGADHDVEFGSVLPTDVDRDFRNELAAVAAGVHSRRYAADNLGGVDDPDAEFDRWLEEERQLPNPKPPTTGGQF